MYAFEEHFEKLQAFKLVCGPPWTREMLMGGCQEREGTTVGRNHQEEEGEGEGESATFDLGDGL